MTRPATRPVTGPDAVRGVLVVNHWHDDNKGDSAITEVTLAMIRRTWPDAEIEVSSLLGAEDPTMGRAFRHIGARFPDVRMRPSLVASLPSSGRRPTAFQLVRWACRVAGAGAATVVGRPPATVAAAVDAADLVVLAGGSNLFDTGRRSPMGTLRLLQCVLPAVVAHRRGTPYLLVGHTLGPATTRLGRRLLRRIVAKAAGVTVREAHSLDFVHDELALGPASARVVLAPDVAFALEPSRSSLLDDALRDAGLTGSRFAVLVPRSYHHPDPRRDEHLATEMTALGRGALDAGLVDHVVVFPQCLGPTEIEDDRGAARRIARMDDRFVVLDVDLGPSELTDLYRQAAFVVAVRLHAVILALSVGTPVHGIEYFTTKTRGVFAAMGLDDHWSEFDAFSAGDALVRIKDLLAPEGRTHIETRAALMRAAVLEIDLAGMISGAAA